MARVDEVITEEREHFYVVLSDDGDIFDIRESAKSEFRPCESLPDWKRMAIRLAQLVVERDMALEAAGYDAMGEDA